MNLVEYMRLSFTWPEWLGVISEATFVTVSPDSKPNYIDMETDRIYEGSMLKLSAKGVSPIYTRAREDLTKGTRWISDFNLLLALKDCGILIVSYQKVTSQ